MQFFIATVPITLFWLIVQKHTAGPLDIGIACFAALVPLSQQIHCWTHSPRSKVPTVIAWLQRHGLLVSTQSHEAHHRAPHDTNYATVSGWSNPILDAGQGWFWRGMASLISALTGAQPHVWHS